MEKKENNKLTQKQIITIVICLLIILVVCLLLVKENKKLVNEHPEYSVEGVSKERRVKAEELFNTIIADESLKVSSEYPIYKLSGNLRKEILYGNNPLENKLLVALLNSDFSISYSIPSDIRNMYFNNEDEYMYESVQVNTVNVSDLKKVYKNMFGEDLKDFVTINDGCKQYIYSALSNMYYLKSTSCSDTSDDTYYIYYNGYNSPYEHHDVATVNVSVVGVVKELNNNLYKVVDVYGDTVKEHLTSKDVEDYVKNVESYNSVKGFEVNYTFDNTSTYGLTFNLVK